MSSEDLPPGIPHPKVEKAPAKPDTAPAQSPGGETIESRLTRIKNSEKLEPKEKVQALRNLLVDIETRRTELSETQAGEKNQLDEVRARLHLPTAPESGVDETLTEVPGPFTHDFTRLDRMRDEAEEELRALSQEESTAERHSVLRKDTGRLAEVVRSFTREADARMQNDMDPFMDRAAFQLISAGASDLEQIAEGKGTFSSEDLSDALSKLAAGLDNTGSSQRSEIREDERSLGKLTFYMQEIQSTLRTMNKSYDKGDERASQLSRTIFNKAGDREDLFARRRNAVRDYLNR